MKMSLDESRVVRAETFPVLALLHFVRRQKETTRNRRSKAAPSPALAPRLVGHLSRLRPGHDIVKCLDQPRVLHARVVGTRDRRVLMI